MKIQSDMQSKLDVNTANPFSFTVALQTVEDVESVQYYASVWRIDIGAWIKKARATFASSRNIWKTTRLIDYQNPNIQLKCKIDAAIR